MKYRPSGSSVHGVSQVRILEQVSISFSKGSFPPRDQTHVSYIGRWVIYQLNHQGCLAVISGEDLFTGVLLFKEV